MITAKEAEQIGLVNKVVEDENRLPEKTNTTRNPAIYSKEVRQQEKQKANELAKILNKKLMDESISLAKEITKNSFNAVKTSKMLINKGTDADINTGLRLEIYGWALCFAHEDRKSMMTSFLNKGKKK